MNNILLTVTPEYGGKRLDAFVSVHTDYSRNSVQILLDSGDITVNGKEVSKSYKVKEGDTVTIVVHPPKEVSYEGENIPLDIYYEDDDILVVNKPKGMVVHPANGNESGTLVHRPQPDRRQHLHRTRKWALLPACNSVKQGAAPAQYSQVLPM